MLAWFRLAGITHKVVTALKRIALPERWLRARPKRLRFQIFYLAGKLVYHARQVRLRVRRLAEQLREWLQAWKLLPIAA